MNIQPIEKLSKHAADLEVHSIFETIQGEGPFCGTPCVFIRLTGCNLQCPGCDTEYTANRHLLSVNSILDEVQNLRRKGLVVITGGEPFRQPYALAQLMRALVRDGYYVQVETNGVLPLPDVHDILPWETEAHREAGLYVVVSPKTDSVHKSVEAVACAYKYVMSASSMDPDDGLPVQVLDHKVMERVARPPKLITVPIYLQPMDAGPERPFITQMNLNACLKSCLKHGYILQLQIHKLIGVE